MRSMMNREINREERGGAGYASSTLSNVFGNDRREEEV